MTELMTEDTQIYLRDVGDSVFIKMGGHIEGPFKVEKLFVTIDEVGTEVEYELEGFGRVNITDEDEEIISVQEASDFILSLNKDKNVD